MNHDKKQIVMDRTFAKLAENVRSEEYAILQQVRQDYPKYKVVQREIAKNPSKESYKGLTYSITFDEKTNSYAWVSDEIHTGYQTSVDAEDAAEDYFDNN